ncbi:cilium assembly protein DZIP1 isoform X1 [Brachyistius frenatus]|uniref:cilium assembly protein DZIP1 isoform X1 n=1 Tax=Brachyistius frenatus TaxID=100188 RepID=UPI0037E8A131
MPFQDGVYYPFSCDTHGTRSSAGIPSLLNSPLGHPSGPAAAPGMTPSSGGGGASPALPFKFRPRTKSMDWRGINAVNVDLVASQLDVDTLQEHVGTVTFCSLDGERCPRCQSPVDPALVKLLQLAQLTVEWLLHCQEFLAGDLRAAEERLAAAGEERERLLARQREQGDKEAALAAELKRRKKVIRTQQSLLAPQIVSSQKCPHCEKSFLNATFLQNHLQRRHPEQHDSQLRRDGEKKSQIDSLKSEIGSLKEQISQQQQTLEAKIVQEKEQQSMHKDLQRELDHFKAEERARMDRKIEDSRDGMRREMEYLYNRNIQALNEANVNQNQPAKHEKSVSPVHSQPERDLDIYKEMQLQTVHKLEHQMKKQDKKWESRLQEMKEQHESEKNQLLTELSRMQSSVSEQQERSHQLQQEMGRRLQEKEQTIKAQREQMRTISLNQPIKVVEVPVLVSAPEPKPKRVLTEEPVSALKLDPIQELSEEEEEEEERDSSGVSERRPAEKKPEAATERKRRGTGALKRNPDIKKEMRPELERAVVEKLENLGIKSDRSGLKSKELASVLARVQSRREGVAKAMPDYWRHRREIAGVAERKLGGPRRGSDPAPESQARAGRPVQVLQIRPRSSSLPSRASQGTSGPAARQPKTPQPTPRTRTAGQPKTSTPNAKSASRIIAVKTPPFSSDEEDDTEEEEEEEEEPPKHQRGKSQQARPAQATPVHVRAGKPSPVLTRQTVVQRSAGPSPGRSPAAKMESDKEDDDWSEVSELQEIDARQLQSCKDQNGNVDERNRGKENRISDPGRKVEKQFADRALKKPAGGAGVLPERRDVVQELTYTDLEESSEWMVSSSEDRPEASKPGPRKSLDSPSTSVWGTSTGKPPKSGLTEAGTGSTLKSSLCSLSDISDSEDFGNKRNRHYC